MATTEESVSAIVALFADIEDLADRAKTKLDEMVPHLTEINANGNAGALITDAMSLRSQALGLSFVADVRALHSDMTEAAKVRDIDVPAGGRTALRSGGR